MRLFVAIEIDDVLRDKLVGVQTKLLDPAVKLVERENLHITLKFIGEVPDGQVGQIRGALRNVKMAPFELDIGGLGTFPGGDRINVVWVDCKGSLAELAANVEAALKPLGFKPDERVFSSHLTVARVKQQPTVLLDAITELKDVKIGRQTVDRFVLKRSTLTPTGPTYEDVEVYTLVGTKRV